MKSKQSKSDYIVSLLLIVFIKKEIKRFEYYIQSIQSIQIISEIYFSFLICKTKINRKVFNEAERQNIYNVNIVIKSIIIFYQEVFDYIVSYCIQKLHDKVHIFMILYDNDQVFLYSHFAISKSDYSKEFKFYCYLIKLFSLTVNNDINRYKINNFI